MMDGLDENPRPTKRQRIDECNVKRDAPNTRVGGPALLLGLPSLILHPPTHPQHARSLFLSLFALRTCLTLPSLDFDVECRAWAGLAEIGLRIGFSEPGIENEVEKAITKALLIAQKHPSLRLYKPHLTLLSAQLSKSQQNSKFAQNTLRRLLTSFLLPSDPPHVTYSAHLALIENLANTAANSSPQNATLKALGAVQDLYALAVRNQHPSVSKMASVLRLRNLVRDGTWDKVPDSLDVAEQELGITDTVPPLSKQSSADTVLLVHVLILGIIFYTYTGDLTKAQTRTKMLHEMLDSNALDAFGCSGIIEITFPNSQPLFIQATHPRIIYVLGFLVSSIAKRDPVGRKPKRKVFANEGLIVVDNELKKEISLPAWASITEAQEVENRLRKMKADLFCEVVGVSIMRSEFGEAERVLAQLIAHTRTYGLFSFFSSRITLHQAQLAHALGQTDRAAQCYRVSAYLSRKRDPGSSIAEADEGAEDRWVNIAARAGEFWVRLGVLRRGKMSESESERELEALKLAADELGEECAWLGVTLGAVGFLFKACLSTEFLAAKTYLRQALQLATNSQDNHLRALILALIASQYHHTAVDHATKMLATADQLAAGLGAQPRPTKGTPARNGTPTPKGPGDGVGNAQLRLWIGERSLELMRRTGEEDAARKQAALNAKLRVAVAAVENRPLDLQQ